MKLHYDWGDVLVNEAPGHTNMRTSVQSWALTKMLNMVGQIHYPGAKDKRIKEPLGRSGQPS